MTSTTSPDSVGGLVPARDRAMRVNGRTQTMVTDTSTMILITAIASAIMALYGAIAGVFFNGDEDDTESVAWYIALFIPIGVAIGVNIPWLDRGAEIFYGTINP